MKKYNGFYEEEERQYGEDLGWKLTTFTKGAIKQVLN